MFEHFLFSVVTQQVIIVHVNLLYTPSQSNDYKLWSISKYFIHLNSGNQMLYLENYLINHIQYFVWQGNKTIDPCLVLIGCFFNYVNEWQVFYLSYNNYYSCLQGFSQIVNFLYHLLYKYPCKVLAIKTFFELNS